MNCFPKLSPKAEKICRWTAFGLTCLSWVFVVASTGTCSFAIHSIDFSGFGGIEYDCGLFCSRINGAKVSYSNSSDLPGSLVAARLFATVACLIITSILIATSLVIFVLPNSQNNSTTTQQPRSPAVRAWWTVRGLCCAALLCVLLTFAIFADCGDGDSSTTAGSTTFTTEVSCQPAAGAALNILNVFILIALIVMTFGIDVPAKPILTLNLFGGGSAPVVVSAATTTTSTTLAAAGPDTKETTTKQTFETELPKMVVPTAANKSTTTTKAPPPPQDQFNDDSLYSC